ncbi:serine/threonine-protein kinase [Sphaerisporangium krabiense]|uniref:non-specific serine/threonine protein kinase n=2 Tax=Sphaerisporangium krabiense TaxID=763782 RepID=A0A7W8ZBW8_9ACTN|nr:serine/threonine-protein kinase [Sphaerisporangium krabiense]MBB5630823.1 hypothetical protein [Sphaerisporangium krabiense]
MTLLAGRYRLIAPIGQGGMGTVWRAADELLRQEVAIKEVLLPPELGAEHRAELRERTLREARAAASLRSHPSIVTVHDVVLEGGQPWIVMELVRGRSLDKIVREGGPLPPARVAAIGLAVLDALGAAHAAGILHRDVKPGNVLITDDGRVLLTDFGIATIAGDPALTQAGLLSGSPGYTAPERLRGEPDGPPSDLWSLGATLYAAVEGVRAFQRDNAAAVMAAVMMHEPRPPLLAGPLAPVLAATLEKDPARRCPPDWVAARLHEIASGAVTGSGATGAAGPYGPTRPVPVRRGRRGTSVIIAAVLAVTVPAAGFALWRTGVLPAIGAIGGPAISSPGAVPPATGGPPAATASPARAPLKADPEACALLTRAQVRLILGAPGKEQFMTKDACMWTAPDGTFVSIQKYRFPTVDVARTTFDTTRSNMKDEPRRYPGTRLREGPAVGDAAYGWTRRKDSIGSGYETTVMFRTANVWASLYHFGHEPGFAAADRMAAYVEKAFLAAG